MRGLLLQAPSHGRDIGNLNGRTQRSSMPAAFAFRDACANSFCGSLVAAILQLRRALPSAVEALASTLLPSPEMTCVDVQLVRNTPGASRQLRSDADASAERGGYREASLLLSIAEPCLYFFLVSLRVTTSSA